MFWEGAMFLRVVRAAGAKGVKNEYVRVVEAYRENGKTRHRTVLNLGRRDLLAAHLDLDKLRRLLQGDADRAMADRAIRREDIGALAAWDWGPMLRVELRQLKTWYRTLDQLLEHKDTIEHALFITLRDLFSLQVDMVFYDLTSTYFEGHGPPGIGANGHSRDGKRRDAKTVPEVLRDLEQRFGLRRIVFVGDRGMVTSHNLDDLRAHGHGYIV